MKRGVESNIEGEGGLTAIVGGGILLTAGIILIPYASHLFSVLSAIIVFCIGSGSWGIFVGIKGIVKRLKKA